MKPIRVTIGGLLGVIVLAAFGLAALWGATDLFNRMAFSLALVVQTGSVVLAAHRRGAAGAFWLGFALFGWIYLVASLIPTVEYRLLTTQGLHILADRWPRPTETVVYMTEGMGTGRMWKSGSPANFQQIGHSFASMIVAGLGGLFSAWAHASRSQRGREGSIPPG